MSNSITQLRYFRKKKNGHWQPKGLVAINFNHSSNELKFSFSLCDKVDRFKKVTAREKVNDHWATALAVNPMDLNEVGKAIDKLPFSLQNLAYDLYFNLARYLTKRPSYDRPENISSAK